MSGVRWRSNGRRWMAYRGRRVVEVAGAASGGCQWSVSHQRPVIDDARFLSGKAIDTVAPSPPGSTQKNLKTCRRHLVDLYSSSNFNSIFLRNGTVEPLAYGATFLGSHLRNF